MLNAVVKLCTLSMLSLYSTVDLHSAYMYILTRGQCAPVDGFQETRL